MAKITCKICGREIDKIFLKRLARFKHRDFFKAEDGDSPGEITFDHYQNIITTINLFKIKEHKQKLFFGKLCPASEKTFKEKTYKAAGRPYLLIKHMRRFKRRRH